MMNLVYKNCWVDNITKLFIVELTKYLNCLIYLLGINQWSKVSYNFVVNKFIILSL